MSAKMDLGKYNGYSSDAWNTSLGFGKHKGVLFIKSGNQFIGKTYSHTVGDLTAIANAQLIADAPKILEYAKRCREYGLKLRAELDEAKRKISMMDDMLNDLST